MPQPEPSDRLRPADPRRGRLAGRLDMSVVDTLPTGLQEITVGGVVAALTYVPAMPASVPRQLVVVLHGAAGAPRGAIDLLLGHADAAGLLLLAPASHTASWDLVTGGYGPDVDRIDRCMTVVSRRYAIDPDTVAIAGFSDGASYALSLGVANGDVFRSVVAFSPGFLAPPSRAGDPRVFISHGQSDPVLPIDRCGRRIVAALRQGGYEVAYQEFVGGHEVPARIVERATNWLVEDRAPVGTRVRKRPARRR